MNKEAETFSGGRTRVPPSQVRAAPSSFRSIAGTSGTLSKDLDVPVKPEALDSDDPVGQTLRARNLSHDGGAMTRVSGSVSPRTGTKTERKADALDGEPSGLPETEARGAHPPAPGRAHRRQRALKSTVERVAEAEVLLRRRQAQHLAERELTLLRAIYAERLGEPKASMRREALIGLLAESYGIP